MNIKRNFDKYVKREEMESAYNYQKRVFESKLGEINEIVEQMRECFSLRFGEEADKKYAEELGQLQNSIQQAQETGENQLKELKNQLETLIANKVGEVEQKSKQALEENTKQTQKSMQENFQAMGQEFNDKIIKKQDELKQFQNISMQELKQNIQKIEKRSKELKENTEEYVK